MCDRSTGWWVTKLLRVRVKVTLTLTTLDSLFKFNDIWRTRRKIKQKQSFRNVHMHPAAAPPINTCMGVNVRKLKQKICIYYWKLDLFTQTSMIYALSLNSVSVINCTLHILHHIYQHQNCHRIWEWEQISYYMYDRGMEGNSRRSLRLFFSTHCVSFHIIIIQ